MCPSLFATLHVVSVFSPDEFFRRAQLSLAVLRKSGISLYGREALNRSAAARGASGRVAAGALRPSAPGSRHVPAARLEIVT